MSNAGPTDEQMFDRLIGAMPRIAEAVNAFSSEENQRVALEVLMRAMGVRDASLIMSELSAEPAESPSEGSDSTGTSAEGVTGDPSVNGSGDTPLPGASTKASGRRRRTAKKIEPVRDIDFHPEGMQSFRDFVDEKLPKSIDQKNLVAVYWLEQVAGIEEIGVGHVAAAYKNRDWREPANPANALQATASREHWLDTKNMKAVVTTPSGRNAVKFEMPAEKK